VHEHDLDDSEMSWDFDEEEYVQEIMHKEEKRKREERSVCREVCWLFWIWGMVVQQEEWK
jgi:hypothetical protein